MAMMEVVAEAAAEMVKVEMVVGPSAAEMVGVGSAEELMEMVPMAVGDAVVEEKAVGVAVVAAVEATALVPEVAARKAVGCGTPTAQQCTGSSARRCGRWSPRGWRLMSGTRANTRDPPCPRR